MAITDTAGANDSVELEFEVRDRELFFVELSGEHGCRVALAEMFHRADGRLLEYFRIDGATPERVIAAAEDAAGIDEARPVRDDPSATEGLYEFVVDGPCIGGTLAEEGALLRSVSAVDGVGRVVADVPTYADPGLVVDVVHERHDADLLAMRQRDRAVPAFTRRAFRSTLADRLTDRQLEALRTAYADGYFEWPRERTAEDCARALDIAQPTFTQHLRASQHALLETIFEDAEADLETAWPSASEHPIGHR